MNKVFEKKAKKKLHELWKGRKSFYKVWECLAKVVGPPPKKVKIVPKNIDCIFIGYAHNSTAYQFLVHDSNILNIHKNMFMESRNASFFKDVFPYPKKSQAYQNEYLILLMEIVMMKITMLR